MARNKFHGLGIFTWAGTEGCYYFVLIYYHYYLFIYFVCFSDFCFGIQRFFWFFLPCIFVLFIWYVFTYFLVLFLFLYSISNKYALFLPPSLPPTPSPQVIMTDLGFEVNSTETLLECSRMEINMWEDSTTVRGREYTAQIIAYDDYFVSLSSFKFLQSFSFSSFFFCQLEFLIHSIHHIYS